MAHNEANDGFHDNQYGGRKFRQPQSTILNKVLTLDVVRYQAEEAGLLGNDAKACYDRVLPYLTAYMLRRLGMPYFLSRFMCVVLKEMEYKIKLSIAIPTKTKMYLVLVGEHAGLPHVGPPIVM